MRGSSTRILQYRRNDGLRRLLRLRPLTTSARPSARHDDELRRVAAETGAQTWFTSRPPRASLPQSPPPPPPDPRTIQLGHTLRTIQTRLPTLLESPLPQDILSPRITLHLFPSTHPHLPTVSGRVAYHAALWTSPIAWGRVPYVPSLSDVKLDILSERMIKSPTRSPSPARCNEQLIVRWRMVGRSKLGIEHVDRITQWLGRGRSLSAQQDSEHPEGREFTGLFVFEFDDEGRILVHTIEHVQESGNWERGVGGKFVALTDWLLGGMKNDQWTPGQSGACPAIWAGEKGRNKLDRCR